MAKKKAEAIGINIGTSERSVQKLHSAVMDILMSGAEQATIQIALHTLEKGVAVNNTMVSNNMFSMGPEDTNGKDNQQA